MQCVVFYSWQSDHPNSVNRGLIQDALEKAAKEIRDDDSILVDPVVDRDTVGVPGSPDITATIFSKIDKAQIFVCDVTIVNQHSHREAPNPNVLIELGYAIRALGPDRIVMVMNTAFGGPELLPFDLRNKRVLVYSAPTEIPEKASERKALQSKLREALLTITAEFVESSDSSESKPDVGQQAIIAVENLQPNRTLVVQRYMDWFLQRLQSLAPDFSRGDERDELLVQALDNTVDFVEEFAQLVEVAVAIPDLDTIKFIYEKLGLILDHYHPPYNFSGSWYPADYDFFKFLGHELFVLFYSFLIRRDRWELVADLLEKGIYVQNSPRGSSETVAISEVSDFVALLEHRNKRLNLRRVSFHADVLHERHTKGPIASVVPMEQFVEADFFLFLREGLDWRAWSTLYLDRQTPRFLAYSVSAKYAATLFRPLKIQSLGDFRNLLAERVPELQKLFRSSVGLYPLEGFRLNILGSQ